MKRRWAHRIPIWCTNWTTSKVWSMFSAPSDGNAIRTRSWNYRGMASSWSGRRLVVSKPNLSVTRAFCFVRVQCSRAASVWSKQIRTRTLDKISWDYNFEPTGSSPLSFTVKSATLKKATDDFEWLGSSIQITLEPVSWFVPNWCLSWFVSSWCSLIEGVINKIYNL